MFRRQSHNKPLVLKTALALIISLFLIPPAFCQSESPLNRVTISGSRLAQHQKASDLNGANLTIRSSFLGQIKLKITNFDNQTRKIILDDVEQGRQEIGLGEGLIRLSRGLTIGSNARKVRASISTALISTNPYLRIRFTKNKNKGRVYEITYDFNSGKSTLRHINLRALSQSSCNFDSLALTTGLTTARTTSPATASKAASSTKLFTVATDCDYECLSKFSGSSNLANNRIAEFVNSASTYYKTDLGINFKVSSQTVRTTSSTYPTNALEAEPLLDLFYSKAAALPKADLKHLITGKNINDKVIGLSYLGVVCADPRYSIGFSEHYNSLLTPIIIAHEIGHNFGADHDPESGEQGIMSTYLDSPYPTAFSVLSKATINAHLNSLGSLACYDDSESPTDGGSTTPPVPSYDPSLTAKFSRATFIATLTQTSGSNCSVELHASTKQSGLFGTSSFVLSRSLTAQSSSKVRVSNLKKVLLKNSTSRAMPYIGLKSICSEGTGYSDTTRLNVGVLNRAGLDKNMTVKNTKLWIALLKSQAQL